LFVILYVFQQEEQQMDETYEQFEERVLNKRAAHMYHVIKSKLDTKDKLTLSEMAFKNNRKQVGLLENCILWLRLAEKVLRLLSNF